MSQSQRSSEDHEDLSPRRAAAAPPVTVSEQLARSLRALGAAGDAWLTDLPGLLAELAADWSITLGTSLAGGQTAYVAEAVTHDGTPVILKVAIPPGIDAVTPFPRELTALRLAGGDPYVELIRSDESRRALLLERLGRPLAALGWPVAQQMDALVRTAARGWRPVPADDRLPNGEEAGRWHANFIPSTWDGLGRPCPERVVDLAVHCATARAAAFDPERSVLVHGDVHNFNVLRVPGPMGTGFRLVDPGGLVSEPAHDLGVIQARGVPGWIGRLAAQEPSEALAMVARSCRRAGRLAGVDAEAVWHWAFCELVSTGLFVLRLGRHEDGETFLAAAGKLAAAVNDQSAPAPAPALTPAPVTHGPRPHRPFAEAPAGLTTPPPPSPATAPSRLAPITSRRAILRPDRAVLRSSPATAPPLPASPSRGPATLFLMVGLPGAGKTTRAAELATAYRALRLTPDEWMIPLFGESTGDGKRDILEGRLISVARQALRLGTSVVLDFGLWGRAERSALRWLAASVGATGQVVYLPVDREVQRARIARREAAAAHTTFPMTEAELDAWREQFEVPDADELDGGDIPGPPPGWSSWPEWAADRWPSSANDDAPGREAKTDRAAGLKGHSAGRQSPPQP